MRILLKVLSLLLCVSLVAMPADARGRNNGHNNQGQSQSSRRQPSANNQGGQRPGGNQGNHGQRPGGNQGNHGQHPGGNQGNHGGPGNGHGGNNQFNPGPGPHPGGGNQFNPGPGPRPGGGPGYGYVPPRPPHRPYMPARPMPYRPPMPPPGFRPAPGVSLFGSILGVTIGTAIGVTMDYLIGHGYDVTGYTNDAVYVNNVSQLNMLWPNATLYYGAGGVLQGSEFVYSTPYFDQGRYNMAYSSLIRSYGAPVSTIPLQGGGIRVNWFGYNGQYVSLQYQQAIAYDGSYRYFTTLSFGI